MNSCEYILSTHDRMKKIDVDTSDRWMMFVKTIMISSIEFYMEIIYPREIEEW